MIDEQDEIEIAGRLIQDLRERDDIHHISRSDYENVRISVIIDPEDLDDDSPEIFPKEALIRLSRAGFMMFSAAYSEGNHPPRMMKFAFTRDFDHLEVIYRENV